MYVNEVEKGTTTYKNFVFNGTIDINLFANYSNPYID